MNLTRIKAGFYRHFKVETKTFAELSWYTIFPLVGILSIGLILWFFKSDDPSTPVFLLTGSICWIFYSIVQKSITYALLYDVWNNCLAHREISPTGNLQYLLGTSLYGVFMGILTIIFVSLVSLFLFNYNFFNSGIWLTALLILVLYGVSEGLIIQGLMYLYGYEVSGLVWSITGIIMVLSGVYYPVTVFPPVIQFFSNLLPTTHAVNVLRMALLNLENPLPEFLIGSILAVALLFLAIIFIKYAEKKSKQTGRILRLMR